MGYVDTSGWTDEGDGWQIDGGNVVATATGSYIGSMTLTAVISYYNYTHLLILIDLNMMNLLVSFSY